MHILDAVLFKYRAEGVLDLRQQLLALDRLSLVLLSCGVFDALCELFAGTDDVGRDVILVRVDGGALCAWIVLERDSTRLVLHVRLEV